MSVNLADILKGVSEPDTDREQIEYIPLSQIDEDPNNFYQLTGIEELADNISLCGLQQPIRVRQKEDGLYIIVSGHRRRAALEMLVADGYEKWKDAPCIVERDEVSPALQQLRLIYANSNTRKMTSAEISEQAVQVEKLLYQLKEDGFDFPGRMRDHVAEAVQVSKSKLARLKVIREKLAACWADDWKNGIIGESVAYNLAQMPKSWQSVIHTVWGEKAARLYADTVSNSKERFERIVKIKCNHGCNLCEHTVTMMEKSCKEMYWTPCSGCCFDCSSLQTCKNCCPQAVSKQKEMKATAKQAEREAKEEQARRDQPGIEFSRMVWNRIGKARERSGCSIEALVKARGEGCYNASYDDPRQEKMERGDAKYTPNDTISFGYNLRACDVMKIVSVADVLQCSVDYLLGRTEDRQSHLSASLEEKPVPNWGTEWRIGDPTESGRYILLVRYDADCPACLEDWEWNNEDGWQDEFAQLEDELVEILGWIPMPKLPAKVHTSSCSCITGMSPTGTCGAAAFCNKEHTCCLQCDEDCNGRCGWIDDVAEEI